MQRAAEGYTRKRAMHATLVYPGSSPLPQPTLDDEPFQFEPHNSSPGRQSSSPPRDQTKQDRRAVVCLVCLHAWLEASSLAQGQKTIVWSELAFVEVCREEEDNDQRAA